MQGVYQNWTNIGKAPKYLDDQVRIRNRHLPQLTESYGTQTGRKWSRWTSRPRSCCQWSSHPRQTASKIKNGGHSRQPSESSKSFARIRDTTNPIKRIQPPGRHERAQGKRASRRNRGTHRDA
ncbi:hypothetical protein CTRI78_v012170 [Colletotrichum trifolii]|uniref:Uncharacterized protein n=1 Tax=Colletotrichum trifolii TaxID=5466 RepID=A0A4R8PPU2_COLTR|nr:hypothetical protein CTRI78_v012202 [Colletotrichum trifolii]TDZ28014.1 hypothetical protein CTRI78_v012170 [Colletotrichum trifolii]